MTWHAPAAALDRYAIDPASVSDPMASSIEVHVLECDVCRAHLAAAVGPQQLEQSWLAIVDELDQPRRNLVERLLEVVGVRDTTARLVAATAALQFSFLGAVVLVVGLITAFARANDDNGAFLVFAPLVPIVTVAATFRAGADPAGEAGPAAPLAGFGLVIRRAVAVFGATFATLLIAAIVVPGELLAHPAWILPALALGVGTLAGATVVRVETAAITLVALWLAGLFAAQHRVPRGTLVQDYALLAAPGQVAALIAIVAAVSFLAIRRDRLSVAAMTSGGWS